MSEYLQSNMHSCECQCQIDNDFVIKTDMKKTFSLSKKRKNVKSQIYETESKRGELTERDIRQNDLIRFCDKPAARDSVGKCQNCSVVHFRVVCNFSRLPFSWLAFQSEGYALGGRQKKMIKFLFFYRKKRGVKTKENLIQVVAEISLYWE